jgi:hypothetical protein
MLTANTWDEYCTDDGMNKNVIMSLDHRGTLKLTKHYGISDFKNGLLIIWQQNFNIYWDNT